MVTESDTNEKIQPKHQASTFSLTISKLKPFQLS